MQAVKSKEIPFRDRPQHSLEHRAVVSSDC